MDNSVAVTVLGSGQAGQRHAAAALRVAGLRLRGFHDIVPSQARNVAARFGVAALMSLEEALGGSRPALAIICTPPSDHGRLAVRALEAGMHVLVEKPFDVRPEAVDEVAREAALRRLQAGAVAQHRFAAGATRLRTLVQAQLQTVRRAAVTVRRFRPADYFQQSSWRCRRESSGGGVLAAIGFHYLDLLCTLLPYPCTVDEVNLGPPGAEVESSFSGRFRLGHVPCSVQAEWGQVETQPDRLEIHLGQKRHALVGDCLEGCAGNASDRIQLHALQLQDLLESVRNGRLPAVSPADVRPALDMIAKLYGKVLEDRIQ